LKCLGIIPLPFGYAKLIEKYFPTKDDRASSFLHLGDDNCFFAIYKGKNLQFYRDLPITVSQLKKLLQGALTSEKGKVQLSADEAQEALFKIGLSDEDLHYKDKISSMQIKSMLWQIMGRLTQEVNRSLTYYRSEFGGEAISSVLVGGEAWNLAVKRSLEWFNQ